MPLLSDNGHFIKYVMDNSIYKKEIMERPLWANLKHGLKQAMGYGGGGIRQPLKASTSSVILTQRKGKMGSIFHS